MRHAPPEFRHAYSRYFLGLAALVVAIASAVLLAPRPLAVAVCFVGVTIVGLRYDRFYREAAEATKARLG